MESSVHHPRHDLTIREYGSGYVTIMRGETMIQLTPDQARWLAQEIEHLAASPKAA